MSRLFFLLNSIICALCVKWAIQSIDFKAELFGYATISFFWALDSLIATHKKP